MGAVCRLQKCWEKNWIQVSAFRRDSHGHTYIQKWILSESGETSIEIFLKFLLVLLDLLNFVMSVRSCLNSLEKSTKSSHCDLWDLGWLAGKKHRNNTVTLGFGGRPVLRKVVLSPLNITLLYLQFCWYLLLLQASVSAFLLVWGWLACLQNGAEECCLIFSAASCY